MKDNFEKEKQDNILSLGTNKHLKKISKKWIEEVSRYKYSYNFTWMGRPIIQFPQDIVMMQEIIWRVKPDLIIETGIARGGSLIFYASMLELLGQDGTVLGIDVDIRPHNLVEIQKHPMNKRITMIEGSSIAPETVEKVSKYAKNKRSVLVILDSNHTKEHVLKEMNLYSSFVTKGSYLVVLDTIIEDMPENYFTDRPWGKKNNPKIAVREFLENNDRFQIDSEIENKLLITVAPEGYLQCVKD